MFNSLILIKIEKVVYHCIDIIVITVYIFYYCVVYNTIYILFLSEILKNSEWIRNVLKSSFTLSSLFLGHPVCIPHGTVSQFPVYENVQFHHSIHSQQTYHHQTKEPENNCNSKM